jgi:curli biogenesis system outer membrane secretion channel CsgG
MGDIPRVDSPGNDAIISCAFTQYPLRQGLRKFPKEAKEAIMTEMQQLHDMSIFKPINKENLTEQERQQVLNSIIFIKE